MRITIFSAAIAALFLANSAHPGDAAAQPAKAPPARLAALEGDYFPLQSREAGHLYHIHVRLPEGHEAGSQRRYPVIYLLDGDAAFPYLAPHHLFLTYDDGIPEAIIVGIAYGSFAPPVNRRDHDFGIGAAAFQRFLANELLPTIEQRTRADPARRILVGQSRGGGFVLYSAYTAPDLFWGRIASNPSFPAHRDLLLGPAPASSEGNAMLAVASGTRDRPGIRAAAIEWFRAQDGRQAPWQLKRIEVEDGTHAADLPNAYRTAMRWLFADQIPAR